MPIIAVDRLMNIEQKLLIGAGVSDEEASIIARHSIGANLAGHDSHGIILTSIY